MSYNVLQGKQKRSTLKTVTCMKKITPEIDTSTFPGQIHHYHKQTFQIYLLRLLGK